LFYVAASRLNSPRFSREFIALGGGRVKAAFIEAGIVPGFDFLCALCGILSVPLRLALMFRQLTAEKNPRSSQRDAEEGPPETNRIRTIERAHSGDKLKSVA
jgi:hypothetical protein